MSPTPFPPLIHRSLLHDPATPSLLTYLAQQAPQPPSVQLAHAWNSTDTSPNILVNPTEPRRFLRRPVAHSTDCVRGLVGVTSGTHIWQLDWPPSMRGTFAVVGLATAQAPLHADAYIPLVGTAGPGLSWGWDLKHNRLYHKVVPFEGARDDAREDDAQHDANNNANAYRDNFTLGRHYEHPLADPNSGSFRVPASILMILDLHSGTLAFGVDGAYLGVAFTGLTGKTGPLYPIVSCLYGDAQVTLRYINGAQGPPSLQHFARHTLTRPLAAAPAGTFRLESAYLNCDAQELIRKLIQERESAESGEKRKIGE